MYHYLKWSKLGLHEVSAPPECITLHNPLSNELTLAVKYWLSLSFYQQSHKLNHVAYETLVTLWWSPYKSYPTSIPEVLYSKPNLQFFGVVLSLAGNSGTWQKTQQCPSSYLPTNTPLSNRGTYLWKSNGWKSGAMSLFNDPLLDSIHPRCT